MRKWKKIISIFLILNCILFIYFSFTNVSNADSILKQIEDQAGTFIEKGEEEADDIDDVSDSVTTDIVGIGQTLTFIGIGVLVCATTYLGIQYMISPPEKQGEVKEKLVGLAVATIVIFGAWGIWKISINIFSMLD